MPEISEAFSATYRNFTVANVPASGDHEPDKREIRAIGALIDGAITNGRTPYATWAQLAAVTGAETGDGAEVSPSDGGTHTDPVETGTVPNSGVYRFVDPTGWTRAGGLRTVDIASIENTIAGVQNTTAVSPAGLAATIEPVQEQVGGLDKRVEATETNVSGLNYLSTAIRPAGIELRNENGWRFVIGDRVYATFSASRGFYFGKATLAITTKIEDQPTVDLVDRLLALGAKDVLRIRGVETRAPYRWIAGDRLFAQWKSADRGLEFFTMMLPASAKVADDPTVNLIDRLGGGQGQAENADYYVGSTLDAAGKKQVRSTRRSDGRRFVLSATGNNTSPALTSDGMVLWYSETAVRSVYAPVEGGPIWPVEAIEEVVTQGDSLTQGAGGVGAGAGGYPTQLAARLSARYGKLIIVHNRGVGGDIPRNISARANGQPALLQVAGAIIPASGSVAVTSYNASVITAQGPQVVPGVLVGVPGTLTAVGSAYTFTRTTPGTAVACPDNSPFYTDVGALDRDKIKIMVYGRNGDSSTIEPAIDGDIAYQAARYKRWLVGSKLTATQEIGTSAVAEIQAVNAALETKYGDRYVDLDSAPTPAEMTAVGFVPDSYGAYANGRTDAADLALNIIPSGMRSGTQFGGAFDGVHLNNFGYALWALRIDAKLAELGWLA